MKYQNVIDLIKLIHNTFGLMTTEGGRDTHMIGCTYGTEPPHRPNLILNNTNDLVAELFTITTGSYLMSNMMPMRMNDFQPLNDYLLKIINLIHSDLSCDEEVNQVKDWLSSIESKNNIPA
jgi:hypothetical protein